MDSISWQSQGVKGFLFGGLGIMPVLFTDDVVVIAALRGDLQLALRQFTAECKATGMRIHTG